MASATWSTQPATGDWNIAAHWYPAEVPTDTATFGASTQTTITFSKTGASVGAISFRPTLRRTLSSLAPAPRHRCQWEGRASATWLPVHSSFRSRPRAPAYTNAQLQFSGSASAGGSNVPLQRRSGDTSRVWRWRDRFCRSGERGLGLLHVRTGAGARRRPAVPSAARSASATRQPPAPRPLPSMDRPARPTAAIPSAMSSFTTARRLPTARSRTSAARSQDATGATPVL